MFADKLNNTMLTLIEKDGKKYVQLTELYKKLKLQPATYARFIREQIHGNEYAENGKEYSSLGMNTSKLGGRPKEDFLLTLEFSKELIMLSKSKVGKKYRDWLIEQDIKIENKELLSHQQIIYLIKLKEVFKFLCFQTAIEEKHMTKYVEENKSNKPFADFHLWRNRMLNIEPNIINERIKQWCIENSRSINLKTKREKIIVLDKYDSIKNAVWDFLSLKGELNALKLADLVKKMAEAEGTQLFRTNEDDLFRQKETIQLPELEIKKLQ